MAFSAPENPVGRLILPNSAASPDHPSWENAIDPAFPAEAFEHTEETLDEFKSGALTAAIRQMMFVSGETADPSIETTGMIEEIVHEQVVEMVGDKNVVCTGKARETLTRITTVEKVN